jgi:hypothetical protein
MGLQSCSWSFSISPALPRGGRRPRSAGEESQSSTTDDDEEIERRRRPNAVAGKGYKAGRFTYVGNAALSPPPGTDTSPGRRLLAQ